MLSLYRRHRPRTFEQVVGQESVVRTLRNAIELGKVHHAYLFVGSRGTGKTSMAKLLACALNAEGGPRTDFSPEDPACKAIMAGNSLDVVEMDAASNNSVDDIRELRENVALAPMGGARRVYILDEAHMLSPAAWNAFLKTLEEPPPHVVFVLATTEAHKVPATIVDRCHRFDFQRPSLEQIASVLQRVAAEESITMPDPAVGMIARKAGGSFRDALGTLEQLVTYGGNEVVLEDVLANLGVADAGLILDSAEALIEKSPKDALLTVQRLADSGRDYEQFMRDLAAHLRHLLVVKTVGEVPDSFAVTAEHTDRLASQARAALAGRPPAGHRPARRGDRRGARGLRAAAAARGGAAEGHPAAGRPVAPGADVPDRPARGAAGRGCRRGRLGRAGRGRVAPGRRGRGRRRRSREPDSPPAAAEAPHASGSGGGSSPGGVIAQPVRAAVNAVAGAAAAVAEVARPEAEEEPEPAIDLERVRSLWSVGGRRRARAERDGGRADLPGGALGARGRPPHRLLPGRRRLPQAQGRGQPRAGARRAAQPHGARAGGGLRAERPGGRRSARPVPSGRRSCSSG